MNLLWSATGPRSQRLRQPARAGTLPKSPIAFGPAARRDVARSGARPVPGRSGSDSLLLREPFPSRRLHSDPLRAGTSRAPERDRSPVAAAPTACSCGNPFQVADCIRTRCAPGRRALRTPAGSRAQGAIKVWEGLSPQLMRGACAPSSVGFIAVIYPGNCSNRTTRASPCS